MNTPLLTLLKNRGVLKYGQFTLRSGQKSSYYFDVKEAFGDPKILEIIVAKLMAKVPASATCIAGSGYGGVTLASIVAFSKKIPLTLVRDAIKDHGTKKFIEGYVPKKSDRICIIDDVFTTGSSISNTVDKLSITGAKFTKSVVVLCRADTDILNRFVTDSRYVKKVDYIIKIKER